MKTIKIKLNFCFCVIFLISSKLCYTVNISLISSPITKETAEAIAPIIADAAAKTQAGLTSVGTGIGAGLKTGLMYVGIGVGVGLVAVAVVGGSYYGYRQYCKHCDKIEQAKLAREMRERAMRIKEEQTRAAAEQARMALETIQKNARIRNNILIGVATTVTGIGLGYAIYRLYKSIQERRQQKKQEQRLFSARQELLTTLEAHAQEPQVGNLGLPAACNPHICRLLALQGGRQALDEVVGAYRNLSIPQNRSALTH